jgi:isoquinoline 1-oxidoreductase alpha subunit
MTAAAFVDSGRNRNATDAQIAEAMNGNICRCGTYVRIRQAVRRASEITTITAVRGEE